MGGGGGMGDEETEGKKKGEAGSRTKEKAQGVGAGVGSIRRQQEANDEDLRAEKDAKAKRGTDGQRVKHI